MGKLHDAMVCELVDKIRQGQLGADNLTAQQERLIIETVKKVVDDMWLLVNPKRFSTIGKVQLLKLMSKQFGIHKVTDEDYEAIFAKTEFNMVQEIDQFELAIFVLRVSGLTVLIDEDRLKRRLYYREHYTRRPFAKRFVREVRKLKRQECLTFL